jgi:hypothetical protein
MSLPLKRRSNWRMGNKVAAKRVPADNLPEVAKEKGVTRTIRSQALMYK